MESSFISYWEPSLESNKLFPGKLTDSAKYFTVNRPSEKSDSNCLFTKITHKDPNENTAPPQGKKQKAFEPKKKQKKTLKTRCLSMTSE